MAYRISIGPIDSATVIVTETAREAADLITSLAPHGHGLSIHAPDGDEISLGELRALAELASKTDAGVRGASPA